MEDILAVCFILVILLQVWLHVRVKRLENNFKNQPTRPLASPASSPVTDFSESTNPPQNQPTSDPVSQPFAVEPINLNKVIAWFKEDWLLKLGAILLLMGFGWLATYAFLHNWIGPMGRISLGIISGALILTLGYWRIRRFVNQGSIFIVLGSTVILLTIYAARIFYGFFTPGTSLAVMFLSTVFVTIASVKYKVKSLAILGLILAGIAPLLTASPSPDYVSLFSYLLIVILGSVWVVALTGWQILNIVGLVIYGFYSFTAIVSRPLFDDVILLFVYAFTSIFFISDALGILKLKNNKLLPSIIIAAGNGLLLLVWILTKAPDEWQSLLISAWMIVFALGSFMFFRATQRREPLLIYAAVSIAMLAAATAKELNGAVLTIAYTVETALIVLTAYLLLKDLKIVRRLILLLIGPVLLSGTSVSDHSWRNVALLNEHFFVLLILAASFAGLGIFLSLEQRRRQDHNEPLFVPGTIALSSLYFYRLLWLSIHNVIAQDDTAVTVALSCFTIIGLTAYLWGQFHQRKIVFWYGGIILGFVVGRLLLVDVWHMALTGRIITFFLIGTMLTGTAFIGRRKHQPNSGNTQGLV